MPIPDGFQPFVPRVVSARARPEACDGGISDVEAAAPGSSSAHGSPETRVDDAPSQRVHADPWESVRSEPACDEERCAGLIRGRAIKLAGEACARALREAIARNPLFVARFVDDAIEAGGHASCKRVRLSPSDAAACTGRIAPDIVGDERLEPGEVVVETTGGTVEAAIDCRARLLVRAAADS